MRQCGKNGISCGIAVPRISADAAKNPLATLT